MKTTRTRLIIEDKTRPVLSAHVHMKFNELRQAQAVLAPEHVYWPDDVSVAILKKLNGKKDVTTIIAELADDYSAPVEAVGADVIEFLQTWADERLISEETS